MGVSDKSSALSALLDFAEITPSTKNSKHYKQPTNKSIWIDGKPPVTFRQFMEDPSFLGTSGIILSPVQYDICEAVLGKTAEETFAARHKEDEAQIIVVVAGKGGGKDEIAVNQFLYAIYVLLNLKNPNAYLQHKDTYDVEITEEQKAMLEDRLYTEPTSGYGERIDFINVCTSGRTAKNVFFSRLITRLKQCGWFYNNFRLKSSDGVLNSLGDNDDRPVIVLSAENILFPKNVYLISLNSNTESVEGYNTLMWCMDEASGFTTSANSTTTIADVIMDRLRSSGSSRFGFKRRGIVISYIRQSVGDFTYELYKKAVDGMLPHVKGYKYTTIEMQQGTPTSRLDWTTRHKYYIMNDGSGREVEIPGSLYDDFINNSSVAEMQFLCVPPQASNALLTHQGKLNAIQDLAFSPKIAGREVIQEIGGTPYLLNELYILDPPEMRFTRDFAEYAIAVDKSDVNDRTVVMLGHKEMQTYQRYNTETNVTEDVVLPRIIVDGILVWHPSYHKDLHVSHDNVHDIIIELCKTFPVLTIEADRWDPTIQEKLVKEGIKINLVTTKLKHWSLLKEAIYNNLVTVPYSLADGLGNELLTDLKNLQYMSHNRIGVPKYVGLSPDLAVCLMILVRIFSNVEIIEKTASVHRTSTLESSVGHLKGSKNPHSQINPTVTHGKLNSIVEQTIAKETQSVQSYLQDKDDKKKVIKKVTPPPILVGSWGKNK